MSKIKTVRRAKWHRPEDRWQVQNANGHLSANGGEAPPVPDDNGAWDAISAGPSGWYWKGGPTGKPPKDYRTTLRRIVTSKRDAARIAAQERKRAAAEAKAKAKEEAERKAREEVRARALEALPTSAKKVAEYLRANPDAFGCQREHVVAIVSALTGADIGPAL